MSAVFARSVFFITWASTEKMTDKSIGKTLSDRIDESLRSGVRMKNADITDASIEIAKTKYCPHRRAELNKEKGVILCKDCSAELDPMIYLLSYARKDSNLNWDYKEARRIEGRIKELKKEEKRIKARISSAKKRGEKYPPLAAVKLVTSLVAICNDLYRYTPENLPAYIDKQRVEARRLLALSEIRDLIL